MGGISVATVFLSIIALTELSKGIAAFDEADDGKCELISSPINVEQVDSQGLKCRGTIIKLSCSGQCLSYERPIWEFPYKESNHRVCSVVGEQSLRTTLWDCDPGVAESTRSFKYNNPRACKCAPCDLLTNPCLYQRKRTMLSRSKSESSYPMKPELPPSTGFNNRRKWASNFLPSPQYQVDYA